MHKSSHFQWLIRVTVYVSFLIILGYSLKPTNAQDTKGNYNGIMPALSPDGTMVAYVSDRDENRDLWLMSADGSNQINVTTGRNSIYAFLPEWSPDSRHILFQSIDLSRTDNKSDLWLVSLDNRKLQRLATDLSLGDPKWSPDGKSIAFVLYKNFVLFKNTDNSSIWLMDSDGKNSRQLISGDHNYGPEWSPDGKSIAYIVRNGSKTQLNLIEVETGKTRTLSTSSIWDYAWAPRSNLIAYTTQAPNDDFSDIWLLQTDTSHEQKLTDKPIPFADELMWSPDEQKILFRSPCNDSVKVIDIWVLNLKQWSLFNTTSCQQSFNSDASWFPDSEHILFRSNRSGIPSIWVISADGKDAVDLINSK